MNGDPDNMDGDREHRDRDLEHTTDELDDRLLALALGLDDDPELRSQIERSPELAERLRAVEHDLGSFEDGLREMVPDEPEGWTDLSDERWARLRPFVSVTPESPAREAARRPLWRRWQAVAPAVVAVLAAAVVFGVVVARDALQMGDGGLGGVDSALMEKDAAGGSSATEGAAAPADAGTAPGLVVGGAGDYATVVVAVAEPLDGAEQPYRVERVLKGAAGDTVRLQTEVGGELAPGTTALLFLDPRDDLAQAEPPSVTEDETQRAIDAGGETDGEQGGDAASGGTELNPLEPAPGVYLRDGETAVVVPLPEDSDPGGIRLE